MSVSRYLAVGSVIGGDGDENEGSNRMSEQAGTGLRIGVDIGGTFTDLAVVAPDGGLATCKIPSTPADYADAVIDGLEALTARLGSSPSEVEEVLHGCTVATNAILERRGARTALVTTKGFRDVLEMQRVRVPRLYDPLYEKPPPLVRRSLRFEVEERLDPFGEVVTPLVEEDVSRAAERMRAEGVEAVAVCFLHSYANDEHERRAGEILRRELPECFVSLSVDVLPQKREYERTSTTVINSYVGPPIRRYVESMARRLAETGVGGRLLIMQSSGGVLDAASVVERPANIIECGPAAGVVASEYLARMSGFGDVITFDMGGTTAKASIIENGGFSHAEEYEVGSEVTAPSPLIRGGHALKLPVIDISEVGAGGGSIAWVDRGGSLKVGPGSAGADPGPACYGKGNDEPTVTDANLLLGYLNPKSLAGGSVRIDPLLARRAVAERLAGPLGRELTETAYGVHAVANASMMKAVKAVTTYRGRDPRDFALLAFGGSGGVHAVELARVLRIGRVILPPAAGVFSAVGLLYARLELNEAAPFLELVSGIEAAEVQIRFDALAARIAAALGGDPETISFSRKADMRFFGQAFELTVPFPEGPVDEACRRQLVERFEAEHRTRYGHVFSGAFPAEVVNLRLIGSRAAGNRQNLRAPSCDGSEDPSSRRPVYFGPALGFVETPVIGRGALTGKPRAGPLVLESYEDTAVVPPDASARLDPVGNVVIDLSQEAAP